MAYQYHSFMNVRNLMELIIDHQHWPEGWCDRKTTFFNLGCDGHCHHADGYSTLRIRLRQTFEKNHY